MVFPPTPMLIINIFSLLGNMKLKQIEQTGQPTRKGTLHCSQDGRGGSRRPLVWPSGRGRLSEPATLAPSYPNTI